MARVKRGVHKRKHHRKVLEAAAGYRGVRSRHFRAAKEQMLHSLTYAYRDRRDKKGQFRRLWIAKINAGARSHGMSYSRFMEGLHRAGVEVGMVELDFALAPGECLIRFLGLVPELAGKGQTADGQSDRVAMVGSRSGRACAPVGPAARLGTVFPWR